jgi:hypothetical protein
MSPFECYTQYLGLKNHFTNPKYDYFKYHKKTKASITSFNKRKDKYFFEKSSRKYSDKEIVDFFVSNFVASDNPQNLWIGEIINSGERTYLEWIKRQQSLTYYFKEQSTQLLSERGLEDVFKCSKGHPQILKSFLGGDLSIETLVIYEKIFNFSKNFNKNLDDPIWSCVNLKISKYNQFLNIDIFHYKKILREILNE